MEKFRKELQTASHIPLAVKNQEKWMPACSLAYLLAFTQLDFSPLLCSRISCLGNGAAHNGLGLSTVNTSPPCSHHTLCAVPELRLTSQVTLGYVKLTVKSSWVTLFMPSEINKKTIRNFLLCIMLSMVLTGLRDAAQGSGSTCSVCRTLLILFPSG